MTPTGLKLVKRMPENWLRANLHAVLMAHSTLESLIKNWPECKKFCPPAPAQVTALALPVEELNKMLGLA